MGRSVERAGRRTGPRGGGLHRGARRSAPERERQRADESVALGVIETKRTAGVVERFDGGRGGVVRETDDQRATFVDERRAYHAGFDEGETVVREGRCRLHRDGESDVALRDRRPRLRRVIGASEREQGGKADEQVLQSETSIRNVPGFVCSVKKDNKKRAVSPFFVVFF